MEDIFAKIIEIQHSGINAALCVLTETSGSVPRKAGSKMIVTESHEIFGTVGGGSIELQIIEKALDVCTGNSPQKFSFNLEEDAEMQCGGKVEVYIEPLKPACELIIFGAGHVGEALGRLAKSFGFQITFVDNRPEVTARLKEDGFRFIESAYAEAATNLHTGNNTYLVVTTPKHEFDQEVTGILGQKNYKYLGMIGSSRKVAHTKNHYITNKILTSDEIVKIDMPIGIKFNAQTPAEIAVSILAKLIDVRNS